MSKVVYRGRDRARTIVLESGRTIKAERGKPVDVSASVAKRLVEQPDWHRQGGGNAGPPKPSKAVKAKAAALGVDLGSVKGTGSNGAVKVSDVVAAAKQSAEPPQGDASEQTDPAAEPAGEKE